MAYDIMTSAQKLEKEKKWLEAATLYEQLLDTSSTVEIYERAAWCFSRAEEYKKAIEYFSKSHELEPLSAKWPYMIGYQYYAQQDWIPAIEWFEKALERYKDYFVVKYRLANAFNETVGTYYQLKQAEYWKALEHLKDCHRLWDSFNESKKQRERSNYFDVNFLHGKMLMNFPRHYLEAIDLFQAALDINSHDVDARYNLANTHYLNGEYLKAKENLPTVEKYYVILLNAKIETKLYNYKEAILLYNQLLKRKKQDYVFTLLSEVYLLNNEVDKAYKASQQAIFLGSNNHKNYFGLAQVYYHYGLLDKAIETLDQASKTKRVKYNSSYDESDEFKEKILMEKTYGYKDDPKLIRDLEGSVESRQSEQSVICHYNHNEGYGFIKTEPNNIFFHVSNCKYRNIEVGDKVEFSIITTDRGLNAVDVKKID